jgi:hypothetical protein
MKSISTDSSLRGSSRLRAFVVTARPGTAEIELLLVIPVLLAILLLIGAGLNLGGARLANVVNAENNAYAQVTAGFNVTPASNPLPLDGLAAIRPDPLLPTRYDESQLTQTVPFPRALGALPSATFTDQALFLDPTWHFAAWPQPGIDRATVWAWFDNYVAEDHPADLVQALGLQPALPP